MRIWAVLIALVVVVCAEQSGYEGYKVYRIQPTGQKQVKLLAGLQDEYFDFWTPLGFSGKPIDVMVHPHAQKTFERFATDNGLQHEVLIDDVDSAVRKEQTRQLLAPRAIKGGISFTKYNRHAEINNYIDQLAKNHKNIVTVETIGQSYEGRDMKVIKISTDPSANKPIIFIDAGIHAREWIAPAQATYIISQLVENVDNRGLLHKVDWHILPVVNPDGYEYTHQNTSQRFWRKTRSRGSLCYGADANRNFEFHWGEVGTSSSECSGTYMGRAPFSEAETRALRDYVLANKDNIKLYLTFHSYGEYLLFPWGYTSTLPDDSEELQDLGEMVANTIHTAAGTTYTVGTSTNVLYAAAGGSDDWVKGVAGIELSYTVELPGGGSAGFDPPASSIIPIVTETWRGIKAYHHYIQAKFGK